MILALPSDGAKWRVAGPSTGVWRARWTSRPGVRGRRGDVGESVGCAGHLESLRAIGPELRPCRLGLRRRAQQRL